LSNLATAVLFTRNSLKTPMPYVGLGADFSCIKQKDFRPRMQGVGVCLGNRFKSDPAPPSRDQPCLGNGTPKPLFFRAEKFLSEILLANGCDFCGCPASVRKASDKRPICH
jgi:hypothetical protein